MAKGFRRLAIVLATAYWVICLPLIGGHVHSTYNYELESLQVFDVNIGDTQTVAVVARSDEDLERILRDLCGPPHLNEFRKRYPEYDDLNNEQLSEALHRRFYRQMTREAFDREFGRPSGRCDGTALQGQTIGDEHRQSLNAAVNVGLRQLAWAALVFAAIAAITFSGFWVVRGFQSK
ncbi:hypothetical protein [Brevundimonas sp.]|uniref:hypothetical protein n=1 Tax=Brevundimonas sp. TaxID=1871086 RepID=UPI002ED963B1